MKEILYVCLFDDNTFFKSVSSSNDSHRVFNFNLASRLTLLEAEQVEILYGAIKYPIDSLNISKKITFKCWLKNKKEFKILSPSTITKGNSTYLYLSGKPLENYEPIDVFELSSLCDKNGLDIYFNCDIISLKVWHGFEPVSVCSTSLDVVDGKKSTLYEYEGTLEKDLYGNPFLLNLADKKPFYLVNLLDCDKYEIDLLKTIYE